MTTLFSTRRRAEEFAVAVDGRNSNVSDELRQFVDVVTSLRSHVSLPGARPREDFARELRARLMTEAQHALVPGAAPLVLPVRQRGPRERRLVAAASVVVLFGGTAGMAAAAQQALPGEALYPIKRGLEQAEAGLSVSTAGRGENLLQQATDRLDEVEGLLATSSLTAAPQVSQTLDDFTAQAQEGAGLLMASFEETRDPGTIIAVREFAAHGIMLLQDLARTAPPDAQDELATAALTLGEIDREASALCGNCAADIPDLEVPDIFLAAAEVDRAFAMVNGRFLELDNSHPFIVDKRVVTRSGDSLTSAPASDERAGSVDSGGSAETESPSVAVPDDTDVSEGDKDVEKVVDDTVDDVTVGQITVGLDGVIATILPDPLGSSE